MFFTIVIPAFNAATTLERAVTSVYTNDVASLIEIIIVDDGSTDNTHILALQLAGKYKNIRVLHQKNTGPNMARQAGTIAATGKYIGFLDSDDYLIPNSYDYLLSILQNKNVDIIEYGYEIVDKDNEKHGEKTFSNKILSGKEIYCFYVSNHARTNALWNKIIRKELFFDVIFPNLKKGEDLCVSIQLMSKAKSYICTNKKCYNYVLSQSGLCNTRSVSSVVDDIKAGEFFYQFNMLQDPSLASFPLAHIVDRIIVADEHFYENSKRRKDYNNELRNKFKFYFSVLCREKINKSLLKVLLKCFLYNILGISIYYRIKKIYVNSISRYLRS